MSRIGKKIIKIPANVTVTIESGIVTVVGPKGKLTQDIHPNVYITQNEGAIQITVQSQEEKDDKALWGLFGSLLSNMIDGVVNGYEKKLEINGVGYKVALSGSNKLSLSVGFSHPVEFPLPPGITATVEKNLITLSGFDKQLIGQTAANLRRVRKPEPYKGKGIKYLEEVLRQKVGKTGGK